MATRFACGQTVTVLRRMSARLIRMFGELVGDSGGLHLSDVDGRPAAHGLYLAAAANTLGPGVDVLGRRLTLEILAPAYAADVVEATTTVTDVRPAGAFGDWIEADVVYRNQHGQLLARGSYTGFARHHPHTTDEAPRPTSRESGST